MTPELRCTCGDPESSRCFPGPRRRMPLSEAQREARLWAEIRRDYRRGMKENP